MIVAPRSRGEAERLDRTSGIGRDGEREHHILPPDAADGFDHCRVAGTRHAQVRQHHTAGKLHQRRDGVHRPRADHVAGARAEQRLGHRAQHRRVACGERVADVGDGRLADLLNKRLAVAGRAASPEPPGARAESFADHFVLERRLEILVALEVHQARQAQHGGRGNADLGRDRAHRIDGYAVRVVEGEARRRRHLRR